MTIGEMVLQYRKEHNLSQRQFALRCNLSNVYINMLEKNTNPCTGKQISISVETADAIASAMGLSTAELLQFTDDSTAVSPVISSEKDTKIDNMVSGMLKLSQDDRKKLLNMAHVMFPGTFSADKP